MPIQPQKSFIMKFLRGQQKIEVHVEKARERNCQKPEKKKKKKNITIIGKPIRAVTSCINCAFLLIYLCSSLHFCSVLVCNVCSISVTVDIIKLISFIS